MTQPHSDRLDAATVARLHDQHAAELSRYLTALLRDAALADDVLQTTFSRLLEKGGRTAEASRRAWLFQVATREAMRVRRRQKSGRRAIEMSTDRSSQLPDVEGVAIRREEIEAVRGALESLPPQQQEVVRRRVYDQMTFAQIATQLDIPLGTALSRMRAALKRLREALQTDT